MHCTLITTAQQEKQRIRLTKRVRVQSAPRSSCRSARSSCQATRLIFSLRCHLVAKMSDCAETLVPRVFLASFHGLRKPFVAPTSVRRDRLEPSMCRLCGGQTPCKKNFSTMSSNAPRRPRAAFESRESGKSDSLSHRSASLPDDALRDPIPPRAIDPRAPLCRRGGQANAVTRARSPDFTVAARATLE